MARNRQVVPIKEDLVDKIRMLHKEHQENPKCRVIISRSLNEAGITTLTGKDWNSGRLSQFIRANLPELVDRPKAKPAGDKTEATTPGEASADTVVNRIEASEADQIATLKAEIQTMVEELIRSTKEESQASVERMIPEIKSSIEADLKQELHGLAQETGKLLNTEISSAHKEYEQRLESSMTRFKTDLDETLEAFRAEMKGLIKEEVQKVLADVNANGGGPGDKELVETSTVFPPKEEIENFVKQQVQSAIKDHMPAEVGRKSPGEFLPAARFVEMIESNVFWWMKNVLKPKK